MGRSGLANGTEVEMCSRADALRLKAGIVVTDQSLKDNLYPKSTGNVVNYQIHQAGGGRRFETDIRCGGNNLMSIQLSRVILKISFCDGTA